MFLRTLSYKTRRTSVWYLILASLCSIINVWQNVRSEPHLPVNELINSAKLGGRPLHWPNSTLAVVILLISWSCFCKYSRLWKYHQWGLTSFILSSNNCHVGIIDASFGCILFQQQISILSHTLLMSYPMQQIRGFKNYCSLENIR